MFRYCEVGTDIELNSWQKPTMKIIDKKREKVPLRQHVARGDPQEEDLDTFSISSREPSISIPFFAH
jgi:hypothetical protein